MRTWVPRSRERRARVNSRDLKGSIKGKGEEVETGTGEVKEAGLKEVIF